MAGLGDGDPLTLEEGLWEAEGLKEGLRDMDNEGDKLRLKEGEREGETLADGERLGDREGE